MAILLVEDEMLIASDTQRELEDEGYTVYMTTSGLKAIAFVKERAAEIDLILMDINLGRGMDGTEAAREILREFDIPILFLSSYTDRGTLEKTQNISSYGFVVKSAGTPVLLASIRMAINLHDLLKELRRPEGEVGWEENIDLLLRPAAHPQGGGKGPEWDALRESEKQYRLIVSLTTDYYFRLKVGEDGRPVMDQTSSNYTELTGRVMEDVSMPDKWASFIHPEDIGLLMGELRRLLIEGGSSDIECRSTSPAGVQRWLRVFSRAVRDSQGARTTEIVGAVKDITARKAAEEKLSQALAQKDILMKEMRHRIKNSLAVVSGLLALESENLDHSGCREVMRRTRTRILSISSIYDLLNQSTDPSSVDLSALVVQLGKTLMKSHSGLGRRFELKTDLQAVTLDAQLAFPLAFILNELITNALTHAYPIGGNGGEIRLVLGKNEGKIILRVEDDGVGFPEGVDPKTAGTTGLSLVRILAEQIDAVCVFSSEGGTKVLLELPV